MTATPGEPALTARGLTVSRDGRRILDGVDLTLRTGETVALLGPNGAGKSTLLAVLAGLTRPDSGTVRSGRVAAALQTPALADRTARANVELALAWWGIGRGAGRTELAQAALALTGAAGLGERPARELSGGEARRVHLARALAVGPEVLLLDEPFAGLDAATRADLLGDATAALRSPARATLVVVHDRAEAWALADRVLVLMAGRLVADGDVRAVMEHPPEEAVAEFLGFDGRVVDDLGILRVRRGDVSLVTGPGGPQDGVLAGTVHRRVPVEDGVACEVVVLGGTVPVLSPNPGPTVGDRVRVRISGGVRYPAADPSERTGPTGHGEPVAARPETVTALQTPWMP